MNNFYTQTVPANQAVMVSAPGRVLSVKTVTGPLLVAMDGKYANPVLSGTVMAGPFNCLNFFNPGAAPVTVTFFTGDYQVPFSPADSSGSNAKTTMISNLGIITPGSNVGGQPTTTPPACRADGYLVITNAMRLLVPGINAGGRRQIIFFSVSPASPASLNVLDPNSGGAGEHVAITLAAGAQVQFETDSDLVLSGLNGDAYVAIGQICLSNS